MTPPRLGPLLSSVVLIFLTMALVAAQDGAPPEVGPSSGAVYREVKALRLVRDLALTPTQIEKILPVVQAVAEQAAADEQADAAAWAQVSDAAGAVIDALLAGADPPEGQTAALDQAATERGQREDHRAMLAADAAVRIQRMLTAEQAQRIETAAEQADRQALQQRLEGASSPVEYILLKLDEQAEFMPDEYLRLREQRALSMSEALLGSNAPDGRSFAAALLRITDEIAGWTPDEFARQRPALGEQIGQALNLPEAPEQHRVTYDDFLAWITSDRTATVLQELLATSATPAATEAQP